MKAVRNPNMNLTFGTGLRAKTSPEILKELGKLVEGSKKDNKVRACGDDGDTFLVSGQECENIIEEYDSIMEKLAKKERDGDLNTFNQLYYNTQANNLVINEANRYMANNGLEETIDFTKIEDPKKAANVIKRVLETKRPGMVKRTLINNGLLDEKA